MSGLLKCITDKVYQLIWILVINWKNSVKFLFYSKTLFSDKNSVFQVADRNCLAYLIMNGFLQPLITKFCDQPRSAKM